jgi:hypothetical protein
MSTPAVQTFRHLSRLARVYLGFALSGIVVGLGCSVVVGPLTPTGPFSLIGLNLSPLGMVGLILFCDFLTILLLIGALRLLGYRPQAIVHIILKALSILDAHSARDNAAKKSRRVEAHSTK